MNTKNRIELYLAETTAAEIPGSFIDYWVKNYGKVIDIPITDKQGGQWVLQKMLTVNDEDEMEDGEISWRNNSSPAELDFSVPYLESILPNWEENDRLIPFAALNTDNAAFDLAVLDFSGSLTPKISIWVHEKNAQEMFLIDIADTVDDFLMYMK